MSGLTQLTTQNHLLSRSPFNQPFLSPSPSPAPCPLPLPAFTIPKNPQSYLNLIFVWRKRKRNCSRTLRRTSKKITNSFCSTHLIHRAHFSGFLQYIYIYIYIPYHIYIYIHTEPPQPGVPACYLWGPALLLVSCSSATPVFHPKLFV